MAGIRGSSSSMQKCPHCGKWSQDKTACSFCSRRLRGSAAPGRRPVRGSGSSSSRLLLLLAVGCVAVAFVWFGIGNRETIVGPTRSTEESTFEPLTDYVTPPQEDEGGAAPTPFLPDPLRPPTPRVIASGLDAIYDIAFSPDGRFLLTAVFGDYSIRVWDIDAGREVQGIRTHRRPGSVDVMSRAERVLVADNYGFLRSYSWHHSGQLSWSRIRSLEGTLSHEIAVSPNGLLLATTPSESVTSSELVLLDTAGLSVLLRTEISDMFRRPAFSPSGRFLAAGSIENTFTVWDLALGERTTYRVSGVNPKSDVGSVSISPDDRLLATGHMDSSITIWDLELGRPLHNFYVPGATTWCVAFSPAGDVLATAQQDGTIRLWDPETAQKLAVLESHKDGVTRLKFHRDGRRLASASRDGRVLLWEHRTPELEYSTESVNKAPEEMTTADIEQLLDTVRGMETIPEEEHVVTWNLGLVPEAKPLVVGLQAMQTDDIELFKTIFSRRAFERFEREGWEGAYQLFRRRWQGILGGIGSAYIHAGFLGSGDEGVLFVPGPTRNLSTTPVQYSVAIPEVPLVRERGEWKIDIQ